MVQPERCGWNLLPGRLGGDPLDYAPCISPDLATAVKDAEIEALREEVFALQDEVEVTWEECDALRAEVAELRAARIAYASEFPKTKDGGPDTGSTHANIRLLKARAERLEEALRVAREYVVSELAAEHDKFAIYEHYSNIESIEADLAKIDAALSKENRDD